MNSGDSILDLFSMNQSVSEVLFSLHNLIISRDIDVEKDKMLRLKKEFWRKKYLELTSLKNSILCNEINNNLTRKEIIERLKLINDRSKILIIILEIHLFDPYFDLNIRHKDLTGLSKASFTSQSKEQKKIFIKNLAADLGFDAHVVKELEDGYASSMKIITNNSTLFKKLFIGGVAVVALAITGGLAAPAIGAMVGGFMGLSGAAATSAGLAFLGGGALSVGGFGMAGGTLFIIGGGAILGVGGASMIDFAPNLLLIQLAKIDVIIKNIIVGNESKKSMIKSVTDKYLFLRKQCKEKIALLENQKNSNENDQIKKIKELKLSEEYYENSIKSLRDYDVDIDLKM